ncbi:MAG: hypothetical protein IPO69_00605 [Saprospiraceae bacterium]|nr:hypothetical protein [Saprospiraceae bacterium]
MSAYLYFTHHFDHWIGEEYSGEETREGDFSWTSLFQNSTANAIYILAFAALVIRFFGNYNKFGNAFDVLILFFFRSQDHPFSPGCIDKILCQLK